MVYKGKDDGKIRGLTFLRIFSPILINPLDYFEIFNL